MKRIIELGIFCIVGLVLAGCTHFPSHRIYKVLECKQQGGYDQCGQMGAVNTEFFLIRNNTGNEWNLWTKEPGDEDFAWKCAGEVKDGKLFSCAKCGTSSYGSLTFKIEKKRSSYCGSHSKHCVRFENYGGTCPNGGEGKGGAN